jgi:hypothetical protein
MPIENNIRVAINDCREKLGIINAAMEAELSKPIWRRRRDLLVFLYKEREVYSFALAQLESALRDDLCAEKYFE